VPFSFHNQSARVKLDRLVRQRRVVQGVGGFWEDLISHVANVSNELMESRQTVDQGIVIRVVRRRVIASSHRLDPQEASHDEEDENVKSRVPSGLEKAEAFRSLCARTIDCQ
ncbi:MAG: hypothetical protein ACREJU_16995, partial [Nitrospiraceae bacterium]